MELHHHPPKQALKNASIFGGTSTFTHLEDKCSALHNNNFYGKIPSELENHTELQRIFILQVSQCSLRDLLLLCCVDDAPDIRQSAFALLGDLARVCPIHLRPHLSQFLEAGSKQLESSKGHLLPLLDLTHQLALRVFTITPKNLPTLHPLLSAHPTTVHTLLLPFTSHPPSLPASKTSKNSANSATSPSSSLSPSSTTNPPVVQIPPFTFNSTSF
ncbi:hypothetical protein K1719_002215 [Acacia pycnantha]|nr:hypothetical protein K1719_002215 [Acacia pycnantha]